MLVLSRKLGERVVVGKDITLTILRASKSRVTIGIEAPKDMKVTRQEPKHPEQRSK